MRGEYGLRAGRGQAQVRGAVVSAPGVVPVALHPQRILEDDAAIRKGFCACHPSHSDAHAILPLGALRRRFRKSNWLLAV